MFWLLNMTEESLVDMHTEIEYAMGNFFAEEGIKVLATVDKIVKKGYNV